MLSSHKYKSSREENKHSSDRLDIDIDTKRVFK